jgi:hypothetical protein
MVKHFVINHVNPIIRDAMKSIGVPFVQNSKQPRGPTYVESDDSVYNGPVKQGSCGRKMRLLHSVKDDEPYRPLRLCPQLGGCRVPVDARPIDTLIQFIPRGAISLDTIPIAAVCHDKPVQVTVRPVTPKHSCDAPDPSRATTSTKSMAAAAQAAAAVQATAAAQAPAAPLAAPKQPRATRTRAVKPGVNILNELSSFTRDTQPYTLDINEPFEEHHDDLTISIQVVDALGVHRYDQYSSWVKIGLVCKKVGIDYEVWERNSARSTKFDAQACRAKWDRFPSNNPGTMALLWKWLKDDDIEAFSRL